MIIILALLLIAAVVVIVVIAKKKSATDSELDQIRKQVNDWKGASARAESEKKAAQLESGDLSQKLEELKKEKQFADQDLQRVQRRLNELIASKEKFAKADSALQEILQTYAEELSERVVDEVTYANLESSRKRIAKTFSYCRKFIPEFGKDLETHWGTELKKAWEEEVRREEARQEQIRIREQMREELRAERERQKEIEKLAREEDQIRIELERMQHKKVTDESAAEIERLKKLLEEAHERTERTKSQAELTKAGHVYVISNIGSFGEGIYKVGMTRRLEPDDRVRELSDASVPFPFDVHMMISTEDAPTLESKLHELLHKHRINKVNLRKEFFRVDLEMIRSHVEQNHGKVAYHAKPEAFEYRETLVMEERGENGEYSQEHDPDEDEDSGAA